MYGDLCLVERSANSGQYRSFPSFSSSFAFGTAAPLQTFAVVALIRMDSIVARIPSE
jgi:hypothetical protein